MSLLIASARFIQPVEQERALFWCVLASLALHALVLLSLSVGGEPAPPARARMVLTATLVPKATEPLRASPQPPQREPEAAPRLEPPKPAPPPKPTSQKSAPAAPEKVAPPEAAPATPAPAAATAQPAAPVETKPASQAPVGIPSTEANAKSGTDLEAGTIEQYRLALIVAARRYKRYPAIAMEKGWQGRVEVHLAIGANGMLASASIKTSSGHEILDNQALDMIRKGKTTVPIPVGLRGREFGIDVPVIFSLDNPAS